MKERMREITLEELKNEIFNEIEEIRKIYK